MAGIWTVDALEATFCQRITEVLSLLEDAENSRMLQESIDRTFRSGQTRLKELHLMARELSLPTAIDLAQEGYRAYFHGAI